MVVCRNPPSPTQGSGKAAQDSLTVTVDSVDLSLIVLLVPRLSVSIHFFLGIDTVTFIKIMIKGSFLFAFLESCR